MLQGKFCNGIGMENRSDVLIVGAGIVGLATAYQLLKALPHLKITIVEKEKEVALHQTGHNSGVIHSGIYYKRGSLKAKNCIEGKKELMAFCDEQGIAYRKLGKVIVATEEEQLPRLEEIRKRGEDNGVALEMIDQVRLREIEPHVSALKAIWVPECCVINYREVAAAFLRLICAQGAKVCFGQKVQRIVSQGEESVVETTGGAHVTSFLINCAGLFSDRIAKRSPLVTKPVHQILPFRGEYYMLSKEKSALVRGLIYPVPDPKFPFLGVHLTRMIDGKVEAGPNAILATAREGYHRSKINLRDCAEYLQYRGFWRMALRYWNVGVYELYRSLSKKAFLRDLQRLVPAIEEGDLSPGGAGVRAQVVTREGKMLDDFALYEEKNMIHVLNAPSPAATASLSIGRYIATRAQAARCLMV